MNRRNCCAVIGEMLTKIPKDQTSLIEDLNWNFEDASYKAPEETLQWTRTQQTLLKHIPTPIQEWEFEVISIFSTMSIVEIKNAINESKNDGVCNY